MFKDKQEANTFLTKERLDFMIKQASLHINRQAIAVEAMKSLLTQSLEDGFKSHESYMRVVVTSFEIADMMIEYGKIKK